MALDDFPNEIEEKRRPKIEAFIDGLPDWEYSFVSGNKYVEFVSKGNLYPSGESEVSSVPDYSSLSEGDLRLLDRLVPRLCD